MDGAWVSDRSRLDIIPTGGPGLGYPSRHLTSLIGELGLIWAAFDCNLTLVGGGGGSSANWWMLEHRANFIEGQPRLSTGGEGAI